MTTEEYLESLGAEPVETEALTEEVVEEEIIEQEAPVEGDPPVDGEPPVETEVPAAEAEPETPIEKQLAIASMLFGREFNSVEEIETFKDKFNTLESGSKHIELIPKLVEKLKSSQNILSYFPDETAYKVAQLSKLEDYKGKESVINRVLGSNVSELSSLEVIELQAKLDAPKGIRNPFRAKLANLGFDPDSVMEGYESLSEDDKDRIDLLAADSRKSLSKLGSDITLPVQADDDVLSAVEAEFTRSREDQAAKVNAITPIAQALTNDLKELKLEDGFVYKLNLSKEEKEECTDFITNAVLSGDYDLSTEAGEAEMWSAVQDLVFLNNKDKIMPLMVKHIREDEQRKARQKSNGAAPITKTEPAPPAATSPTLSASASLAKSMIDEMR